MKVLYVIDTLAIGGSEQSLLSILSRFQRVTPVMCHIYQGEDLKQAYVDAGVPVISLGLRQKYGFDKAIRALGDVVRAEKPDLIHCTLFRADIVARIVGRRYGVPVVDSLVNDSYSPLRWQSFTRSQALRFRMVYWLDRVTARLPAHYVANSAAIARSNARAMRIPAEKISVIYRGRDPDAFSTCDEAAVRQVKQALGLDHKGPILLNVARLIYRKGQKELLAAMPAIVQRFPNVHLLIAGEGPHRPVLEQQIRTLGLAPHVTLLGARGDVPLLLQAADLFVFPSHYEGHSGALVEAMFARRPIVAADTEVHRETIEHGRTGRLFRLRDVADLGEQVLWMLEHPQEAATLGEQARQDALQRFDIRVVARQHEELYHMVMQRGEQRR